MGDVPAAWRPRPTPAGGDDAALHGRPNVERRERVRTRGRVDVERAAEGDGPPDRGREPVVPMTDALGTSAAAAPGDATSSGAAARPSSSSPLLTENAAAPCRWSRSGRTTWSAPTTASCGISSTDRDRRRRPAIRRPVPADRTSGARSQGRVIFDRRRASAGSRSRPAATASPVAARRTATATWTSPSPTRPTRAARWSVYFFRYDDALVSPGHRPVHRQARPDVAVPRDGVRLHRHRCRRLGPHRDATSPGRGGGDDDAAYFASRATTRPAGPAPDPGRSSSRRRRPTSGSWPRPTRSPRPSAHVAHDRSRARAPAPRRRSRPSTWPTSGSSTPSGRRRPIAQGAGSFAASPWPTSAVSRGPASSSPRRSVHPAGDIGPGTACGSSSC